MSKDRQQVADIIAGSTSAFRALVEEHQRLCSYVIGRMVTDRDQIQDLMQDTFLAVYRQLHSFRFECSLKTWISRLAYTTALQYLRRRKLESTWFESSSVDESSEAHDQKPQPHVYAHAQQTGERLESSLARLTRVQRLLVVLHYVEEFDITEISRVTLMPAGTVKSHLFRARQALKADLLRKVAVRDML